MNPNTPLNNGYASGGRHDIKKIMKWLGFVLKCPICGNRYKLEQTRVISSEQSEVFGEARILIHSDCVKCKSSVMFNIEIQGPEIFSVGMVTDLTKQDTAKFQDRQPIGVNEVISLHKELAAFNGDFMSQFADK